MVSYTVLFSQLLASYLRSAQSCCLNNSFGDTCQNCSSLSAQKSNSVRVLGHLAIKKCGSTVIHSYQISQAVKKVPSSELSQQQKPDHTIEVTGIPDHLLKLLDERVQQAGIDRAEYILKLLQRDLLSTPPQSHENARPDADITLTELLSPVHQQVKESGITEEELDDLFEEIREDVWLELQQKSGSQ